MEAETTDPIFDWLISQLNGNIIATVAFNGMQQICTYEGCVLLEGALPTQSSTSDTDEDLRFKFY